MKGVYKYTDLKTGEIVYVGKDSHIDKHSRHKEHLAPSKYNQQQINRVLQNNPDRYEYGVIWASDDCTTLKLNKMEILFGKIYNPKFNFGKFGAGGSKGHSEETKKKISELKKGHEVSKETRKKIGEAHKGKIISEECKLKMSKSHNTSGYFRVHKKKDKSCKQGFIWEYRYYDETGKRKSIISVDIKKLEAKVKAKGLKWECIKND